MASFYTKFEFEDGRSKDLANAIAEFIVTYNKPQNLEIKLEKNVCSIFYESKEDDKDAINLKSIFAFSKNIGEFCYEVKNGGASTKKTVGEILSLIENGNAEDLSQKEAPKPKRAVVTADLPQKSKEEGPKKEEHLSQRVIKVIENLDEGKQVSAKEIAQILGIEEPQKVAFSLVTLAKNGKIARVSRGKYAKIGTSLPKEKVAPKTLETQKNAAQSPKPQASSIGQARVNKIPSNVLHHTNTSNNFTDLSDIPYFKETIESIDFSMSREENVEKVLNKLFEKEMPDEDVKRDLLVRSIIAVTIVSGSVNFETIRLNLEDYDTGVDEKSKEKADDYLKEVFIKMGYSVSYFKFLVVLNKTFMQKYRGVNLNFKPKATPKRLKMKDMPENIEFEVFLAKLAMKKAGKMYTSKELIEYMRNGEDISQSEYNDILEVFVVSYELKSVNEDFIFVNGNFKSPKSVVVTNVSRFINRFVERISGGKLKSMSYIKFLNELNSALRSYVK